MGYTKRERRARAEAHARQAGMPGLCLQTYPPIDTPDEVGALIDTVAEDGVASASNVHAATKHLARFSTAMTTRRYRQMALTIIDIILWHDQPPEQRRKFRSPPTNRLKLRAIQGLQKVLLDFHDLLHATDAKKSADPALMKHQHACLRAFMKPFTDEILEQIAEKFCYLTGEPKVPAERAFAAAMAAADQLKKTTRAISTPQKPAGRTPRPITAATDQDADDEFNRMRQRLTVTPPREGGAA